MKRIHLLLATTLMAVVLSGCVVRGRAGVYASAPQPELVYVSPGVHVIADYDEPVFYSEGAYWRYYGGVWYRSHVYTGGWVRVHTVPVYVRRIDRPHTYVRYRARGQARGHYRNQPPARGPVVRDHRQPAPRGPVVRDHRDGGRKDNTVRVKAKGKVKVKMGDRDHRRD